MTVATVPTVITEPGLYDGLPEDQYHLDPVPGGSLSSTGARELLTCAAKYSYRLEHGRPDTKALDLGRVAHSRILGVGIDAVILDFPNYKTKKAQDAAAAARAAGQVPLLPDEDAEVNRIVAAFRASPAAALLAADGRPERSLFWVDDETGVWCRARLDWSNGLTTVDLKTTKDANPRQLGKAVANWGYHIQYAFYLRGIRALGLAGDREPEFVFVFLEKEPPYLLSYGALDRTALDVGDELVSRALRRYAECQRTGYWPGYGSGIHSISLPRWAEFLPEEYPS